MSSPRLGERYTVQLGCLLDAKARGNAVTTLWQYHRLDSPAFVRPRQGDHTIKVECPRCKRIFAMTVESVKKAEIKRRVQTIVGAVLLASLLIWMPMLFEIGGRTVDENDAQSATLSVGVLVSLVAFSFVVGLTLVLNGRRYTGFRKVRQVRPDGSRSMILNGHKLQS